MENIMKLAALKVRIYLAIAVLFLFTQCDTKKQENPADAASIQKEQLKLRNLAFCTCLTKSHPEQNEFWIKEGSTSGYFQTSAYDLNALEKIDSLATIYAKMKYDSYENKSLAIMKCLDFYNSKALDEMVVELAPSLKKDAVNKN
jgi:hypothetical protein